MVKKIRSSALIGEEIQAGTTLNSRVRCDPVFPYILTMGREVISGTTKRGVGTSRNMKIKKVEGGWMR